jgi:hypothetical protein
MNPTPNTMRPFVVAIKSGATVVHSFMVYAPDSMTAAAQHECLCEKDRGEYLRVSPLGEVRK